MVNTVDDTLAAYFGGHWTEPLLPVALTALGSGVSFSGSVVPSEGSVGEALQHWGLLERDGNDALVEEEPSGAVVVELFSPSDGAPTRTEPWPPFDFHAREGQGLWFSNENAPGSGA